MGMRNWIIGDKKFPTYKQHDAKDCGPTCLKIIGKFYGKEISNEYLNEICNTNREGTSLLALNRAAERMGFNATGARLSLEDLQESGAIPCIGLWNQNHYIVIYKVTSGSVYVSDPAIGKVKYKKKEFMSGWAIDETPTGIILALEKTEGFNKADVYSGSEVKTPTIISSYIKQYKKVLIQLILGLILASILQLIFPFLTQSIVDTGIVNKDVSFIYMILLSQLMVFLGKTAIEIVRSFVLLHLSSRINIGLLSSFFTKLMKLPLGFFDKKMVGDIFQRIYDHQRVEAFLTSGTLNFTFSFISLLVFSGVLLHYSPVIFSVFLIGSGFYFIWVSLFLKRRSAIDKEKFSHLKANQDKNFELVFGMQEIKLQNAELKKRAQWELVQKDLFFMNIKSLTLKQWQTGGASIINELKNIIVSFICAILVIKGDLTLGMMLAISYIIGQLNTPISQMVDFVQSLQDAKLSLERIREIHNKAEEDISTAIISNVPQGDIELKNLSFSYDNISKVLSDLSITFPQNKVTAIVGSSGSGKTTLIKLLLKFYKPTMGQILINNTPLSEIDSKLWRSKVGVVMQEGYIFDDNIINNIAVGDDDPNIEKVIDATKIANIYDFIVSQPLGFQTKIGTNGMSPSTGQKQRILIARAIYKNPQILIFDEATSALDATNEKTIVDNLQKLYKGRTVIIIAHRLSTVKNADNIVVLDQGGVLEEGDHCQLVQDRGVYYDLVRNQLEIDK